jgi:type II secretory pathway pseudopilin PulG
VAVMKKSAVNSRQSTVRSAESGLTIVEMLLAVALLGFVLLGITPLFVASVKSNYSANEYTSINMLARDRLERLMNLQFDSGDLSPGDHCTSDLAATLPDPKTGLVGTVPNPFRLTYTVRQYQIPGACGACGAAPVANAAFTPTEVVNAGAIFQYKRIDVTVTSGTGPLGIGTRASRVSGVLSNPSPETIVSGDFVACGS